MAGLERLCYFLLLREDQNRVSEVSALIQCRISVLLCAFTAIPDAASCSSPLRGEVSVLYCKQHRKFKKGTNSAP